jgi:hypothetical protein
MITPLPLFYLRPLCDTSPRMQKPTVYKHRVNGRLCYWLRLAQASIPQARLHSPRWLSQFVKLELFFLRLRKIRLYGKKPKAKS